MVYFFPHLLTDPFAQLVYVYRQHAKLLTILQQMANHSTNSQNGSADDSAGGAGLSLSNGHGHNPVQSPLHEYCLELQSTLSAVISKVISARDQHQVVMYSLTALSISFSLLPCCCLITPLPLPLCIRMNSYYGWLGDIGSG